MAKLLQLRGGTTSEHSSFTGAVREVTVDTDKDLLVVHDGSTAGGFPAHRDLKGGDIASASPTVIPAGSNYFDVTGTTGFSAFTVAANTHFFIQFDGILIMTHHATNLDLPGGLDITTAVGDVAEFFATAANQVQCVNYTKVDGSAVTGKLDATPTPDHTINGPQTNDVLAGYTTAIGDLVYLDPNGRWEEADADATSSSISLLGIAMEVKSDGAAVNVALSGSFIVDASWSFGVGVPLYISNTLGAITATKPTGSGDVVRTVGYALTATTIFFAPSSDYVTLA